MAARTLRWEGRTRYGTIPSPQESFRSLGSGRQEPRRDRPGTPEDTRNADNKRAVQSSRPRSSLHDRLLACRPGAHHQGRASPRPGHYRHPSQGSPPPRSHRTTPTMAGSPCTKQRTLTPSNLTTSTGRASRSRSRVVSTSNSPRNKVRKCKQSCRNNSVMAPHPRIRFASSF